MTLISKFGWGLWPLQLSLLLLLVIGFNSACDEGKTADDDSTDGMVYFLVSEFSGPSNNDSFILPLSEPEQIAQARNIIANPDGDDPKLITAQIEMVAGETTNRNLIGDGASWSWEVTRFDGFTDTTIEIYDGWPTYVEENLDEWFRITGSEGDWGYIGFWSYTVSREVDRDELGLDE